MKRGRISAVPLEEQKCVLSEFKKYFSRKNDLPSPCDPIYQDITERLSYKMSTKALYLSIKKNYDLFFGHDESDTCSDEFAEASMATNKTSECETYNFFIDIYQWNKIKPIDRCVKRTRTLSDFRSKTLLPSHQWANLLREEIWKRVRSPCSWIFQNYSIKKEANIRCYGSCKQCKAKVEVVINWPTEKIARCICTISNYDETFKHDYTKKIKLSPVKRCKLSGDLKFEHAVTVRNKLSDSIMNKNDDFEPAHLPTVGCLRQIKYEQRKSTYYDPNPIMALWIMTRLSPYDTMIRSISVFPICIYYWSIAQEQFYRDYRKSERTVLSLDATGSIFKPCGPNKDLVLSKPIFLYSCVLLSVYSESVPIIQMLSDNHTSETIYKWLDTWCKTQNNATPSEVVVDDCAALIGAVVRAFTKF